METRVIQIRGVPGDLHEVLTGAAETEGLSLNRYLLRELRHLAQRAQVVHRNAEIVRETQASVRAHVDRRAILDALREGREE